ncbi:EF-hand domain-containing protein [Streptomyces phaeochromogenes]|uniref:EF-hand domain-containing protein n=1 Tax=Streptomyces phaeochromogenes TaxID=1923 RepID=UPI002E2BDF74|nr:EF-hand domain-containing protein [Streptomyces phaeochromogenes]
MLQDLKYGQWFRGADVDGDGFIIQRDVRMMSERYIAARGTAPDSATVRLLAEGMDGFWTDVIAPLDQDGDGKVDLREMTEGFKRVLTDPALYPEQIEPVFNCFFDLVDLNEDGKIDQAEFRQMFDSVAGVPGEDCAAVFAALDPEAPANHLFGRVAG